MDVPSVNQVFDTSDAPTSSLRLASFLFPRHELGSGDLEAKALTQGTTNGLFKVSRRAAAESDDEDAVLVKVYGDGTEITIDREKELRVHKLLSDNDLSSSPLVRFANGHAYQFMPGTACSVDDMSQPSVWRCVARELARWHATLPVVDSRDPQESFDYKPSIWSTAKKWLDAIPDEPKRSTANKEVLCEQLQYATQKLLFNNGAPDPLVLGHGDLLSGNILVHKSDSNGEAASVRFIDYEHATYCPQAFELANHFAEWAGFECDYTLLPTRSTRRDFIREYLQTHSEITRDRAAAAAPDVTDAAVDHLMGQVDAFRGFPGFYWGLCALIQAETSTGTIEFDYGGYAEKRLDEYRAWRSVDDGNIKANEELPLREKRWALP
ncbi:hypothetical protein FZEAL_4441 [Fusarium zealandicum]|uniref:ethanolamine kinase n=1 Tax=Fusarium zealandicum TaxID=1053134 RepID=A0A8H4ULQ5_9HYPO|nr:hypothetical protein FZEAL_4441 [Fusarium zealandicum]